MCRNVMHVFCAIALSIFGLQGIAQSASLGKVDVASHLGEPFYAEVPLGLDKGEAISSIFVELASPADYQILEVFHDDAVGAIRTDVKSDSRGNRVELTSTSAIEAPFLNIVLKVRHGRATHFKKFSIFLDLPRSAKPGAYTEKVVPVKKIGDISTPTISDDVPPMEGAVDTTEQSVRTTSTFKAYDGWARTEKYGPMVYGDTVSTVADRLRIDARYSRQQVMMALFEKNKDKFDKGNVNLIKAGTYLDVPSAQEVEHISRSQALTLLKEHNAKWKELTKQSKYARIEQAQKNRYGKHVRMGETASGVASEPVAKPGADSGVSSQLSASAVETSANKVADKTSVPTVEKKATSNAEVIALKQENTALQQRLQDMEMKVAKLSVEPISEESLAASKEQIKKLELQLARQAGELEKARKQAAMQQNSGNSMGLLTWVLIGIVGLLAMVAGYLVYALRGQRADPVVAQEDVQVMAEEPSFEEIDIEEVDVEEVATEAVSEPAEAEEVGVESVDFEATVMASSSELQGSFGDTVPDLTDEDTSEIQAFVEADEEPDPNVDYLTEADVYMRYGMEDEAEKQVSMALRLRPDNKDAHIKLAQVRHARGDFEGVNEAGVAARSALAGDALAAFEAAFDALDMAEATDDTASLDDTMPPTDLENIPSSSADEDSLQADSTLDIADFDLPDFSENKDVEASVEDAKTEEVEAVNDSLDLGELDWATDSDVSAEVEETVAEQTKKEEALADTEASETVEETVSDELLAAKEMDSSHAETVDINVLPTVTNEVPESSIEANDSGETLNLSDMDMPDESEVEFGTESVASALQEGELESTVVMDWSEDTSVIVGDEEVGGESGANHPPVSDSSEASIDLDAVGLDGGLDIDLPDLEDLTDEENSQVVGQENEVSLDDAQDNSGDNSDTDLLSSVSFDLDGLDIDMDAAPDEGESEDFTSTIQSTIVGLGIAEDADGASLSKEKTDDKGEDFDVDMELDSLLSDLDTFSGDEKKGKK